MKHRLITMAVLMTGIIFSLSAQEKANIKMRKDSHANPNASFTISKILSCSGGTQEVSFSANNTNYYARNDGSIAYRMSATDYGFEFPRGTNYSLVYAGGFYLGGIKTGISGNPDTVNVWDVEFQAESRPGRILNSGPLGSLIAENYLSALTFHQLPGDEVCWPVEAPNNGSGQPILLSQKDTWAVFNDLSTDMVTDPYSLSPGFGFEVQRQSFQFNSVPCSNAVFVRMKIINKSDRDYPGFYIGLWQDPDVGSTSSQDVSSVDSNMGLGYTYSTAASADPAMTAYGCLLLQGPIINNMIGESAVFTTIDTNGFIKRTIQNSSILKATSITCYRNSSGEDPSVLQGDLTRYNYLQGLTAAGTAKPGGYFDVGNGSISADQRFVLSSGPFTFAAGDTQEIWYAMIGAQGSSNANAVTLLLDYANQIKYKFNNNINSIVGVNENNDNRLNDFALLQNYPNPFNPSTTISYRLPENGRVSLKIYNVLGQEIRTLVNGTQSAGLQAVQWDGKDNHGQAVSSGVYFYRLETSSFTKTMKMMMMR